MLKTPQTALGKTINLAWVAFSAFILGSLSERFSGSALAWSTLILGLFLLLVSSARLINGF